MDENNKDFILSDGSQINSHGFRVLLSGGIYARFDVNPVLLYDHDTGKLIGRWENRRIENNTLRATPIFDLNDPFAAEQARKVKEGFLKGASIGIRILKLEVIGDEYVATEWELIEASITPIPSDAGAVRLYDENRQELSFEQVKLGINANFNHSKNQTMADEKKTVILLSASTVTSLGLKPSYDERDIDLAVAEKDNEIDRLTKALEKEQEAKTDTYLSALVESGKINTKQKDALTKLAKDKGFEAVKEFTDTMDEKPQVSLKDLEQKQTLAAERAGWSFLDWMQKDQKGLEDMRLNNNTEYERLKNSFRA